jgi:hypothetical protein
MRLMQGHRLDPADPIDDTRAKFPRGRGHRRAQTPCRDPPASSTRASTCAATGGRWIDLTLLPASVGQQHRLADGLRDQRRLGRMGTFQPRVETAPAAMG